MINRSPLDCCRVLKLEGGNWKLEILVFINLSNFRKMSVIEVIGQAQEGIGKLGPVLERIF